MASSKVSTTWVGAVVTVEPSLGETDFSAACASAPVAMMTG